MKSKKGKGELVVVNTVGIPLPFVVIGMEEGLNDGGEKEGCGAISNGKWDSDLGFKGIPPLGATTILVKAQYLFSPETHVVPSLGLESHVWEGDFALIPLNGFTITNAATETLCTLDDFLKNERVVQEEMTEKDGRCPSDFLPSLWIRLYASSFWSHAHIQDGFQTWRPRAYLKKLEEDGKKIMPLDGEPSLPTTSPKDPLTRDKGDKSL
ncbi:hypothetical protein GOBAR_DD35772 [Gossypium barbadense]|nr:hypothetical protein GOBAR_DD35772 [Gossypium barbadense]